MIIDAIISLAYTLFSPLVALFPTADATAVINLHEALYNIKLTMGAFNWIFPVDTFFFCLNITLAVIIGIGVIRVVRWIASILTVNTLH